MAGASILMSLLEASHNPAHAALRTLAWLDACGVEIIGYPEAHNCVEVGFFAMTFQYGHRFS
jgi:hypothetical protein